VAVISVALEFAARHRQRRRVVIDEPHSPARPASPSSAQVTSLPGAAIPARLRLPPPTLTGYSRYRRRLEMYCTIPSGTRYQIGCPLLTRARHSVDEIARAGISTSLTRPFGRSDMDS
jgi:hypothetical protein